MRIAFATTDDRGLASHDVDRPFHQQAFDWAGVNQEFCRWRDPTVDWEGFDLVVIRSVWDSVEHLNEFVHWIRHIDGAGTLRNPAPLVEWNLDKRYLLDLAALGTPVIPSRIASKLDQVARAVVQFGARWWSNRWCPPGAGILAGSGLATPPSDHWPRSSSAREGTVDLVRLDDGTHAVLELELAEPALYLRIDSGAAERFLAAVVRQVRSKERSVG